MPRHAQASEDAAAGARQPGWRQVVRWFGTLAAVLGLGAYLWANRDELSGLPPLPWGWVAVAALATAGNLMGYALAMFALTRRVCPEVRFGPYLGVTMLAQAANLFVPARAGIVIVGGYLRSAHGLGAASFVGVVAAYHVALVGVSSVVGLASALLMLREIADPRLVALSGVLAASAVAMLAVAWAGRAGAAAGRRLPGPLRALADAADVLRLSGRREWAVYALGVLVQNAGVIICLHAAYAAIGKSVALIPIGVERMAGGLAGILAITPQGLGVVEGVTALVGEVLRIDAVATVTAVLLSRLVFVSVLLAAAGPAWWATAGRRREPAAPEAPPMV